MRLKKTVTMVEAHAEGEVGRIVTGGVGALPGSTMLDALNYMNGEGDALRRFLVFEPWLCPDEHGSPNAAAHPQADVGFIVMQGDKAHAMSGSNTICLATVFETGQIDMVEPQTNFTLDTASGLVAVSADCQDGKCRSVTLKLTDCYADSLDQTITVEGYGDITFDVAFGGIFMLWLMCASLASPSRLNMHANLSKPAVPSTGRSITTVTSAILNSRASKVYPTSCSPTSPQKVHYKAQPSCPRVGLTARLAAQVILRALR